MSFFARIRKVFGGGDNSGKQDKPTRESNKNEKTVFEKRTDYAQFALSDHKNPYLEAVVGEMISNTVGGNGISVTPQPKNEDGTINKEAQAALTKLWNDNKNKLDAGGRHAWPALNCMIAREMLAGGEAFLVKIKDPDVVNAVGWGVMIKDFASVPYETKDGYQDGVLINEFGKSIAYLFSNGDAKPVKVTANEVIHAACYYRAGDTRGYSQVAPACPLAVEIQNYDKDAGQLVAASMRMSIWCISDKEVVFPTGVPVIQIKAKKDDADIKSISTGLTNTFSKDHRQNVARSMCAAAGTGYGATMGEFDGSYSASRQEMIVAAQKDLARQAAIVDTAIRPIYEAFVMECLKTGLITASAGDIFCARYVAPRREHIDPLKEAKSVALKLATNQTTLSDVLASQGKDFDLFIVHLNDELTKLRAAGLQPNGVEALKWLELNIDDLPTDSDEAA